MATIYIPDDLKPVADRLANTKTTIGGKTIFPTYMHMVVFAAMVGHSANRKEEVEAKRRGSEIYDSIFVSNSLDGVAYLLAIHEHSAADVLRDTRDSECWRVIESYAAGGLRLINEWLVDHATDIDGVDTLLARMKEKAADLVKRETTRLSPTPEF